MNTANTTKSRGTVVKVPDTTPGILFVNATQQPFTLERVWKSPVAPAANQVVDVEFDAVGAVTAIIVVDQQQLAKEKLTELGGVAQERGKEAALLAQQGIGALAARMGRLTLGAAVLVWIAWFLLPAAGISGGPMPAESYTFWTLLGTDFSNDYSAMDPGHHHGFFAFIGLLAIVGVAVLLVAFAGRGNRSAPTPGTPSSAAAPKSVALQILDARDYDPFGDNQVENPRLIPHLYDHDLTTTWETEHYNSPDFGKQKRGAPRDHRHRLRMIKAYEYHDAASLLADFWKMVDAVLRERGVIP